MRILTKLGSSRFIWPAALFVIAGVLRTIAALRMAVIFGDGPTFIRISGLMGEGRWAEALGHPYHPLYPLMIFALRPIVPDPELAGVALSVLAGSLAVVALYAFLVAAYGRRVATLGALLLALSPYAIRFSADVQSDAVYLALFLSSLGALYRALRDRSSGMALLSGGLTGLAYLTRPEGLTVAIVGIAMATAVGLRDRWRPLKLAGWVSSMAAGVAIPALPYLFVLRIQSGHWTLSQKKSVLELLGIEFRDLARGAEGSAGMAGDWTAVWWLAILLLISMLGLGLWIFRTQSSRPSPRRFRIGWIVAGGVVLATGILAMGFAPPEALEFSAVLVSTARPELEVLILLGVVHQSRREPDRRAAFVAIFTGVYCVMLFGLLVHYGYLSRRHALPPIALLMGYGAIGLLAIENFLRKFYEQKWARTLRWKQSILCILLVWLAAVSLPKTFHDDRSKELAGRRAAEWLRDQPESQGAIASKRSKLAYYADRPWQRLYENGNLLSVDALDLRGAKFLVVERSILADDREGRPMPSVDGGVVLVERHRVQARGYDAVLYELRPAGPGPGSGLSR